MYIIFLLLSLLFFIPVVYGSTLDLWTVLSLVPAHRISVRLGLPFVEWPQVKLDVG